MDNLVPDSEDPIELSNLVEALLNLFVVERQLKSLKRKRHTNDTTTLAEAKEKLRRSLMILETMLVKLFKTTKKHSIPNGAIRRTININDFYKSPGNWQQLQSTKSRTN